MAGIARKEEKYLIFIVVPLLRLESIKEKWKTSRKIYSKYIKIFIR